MLTFEFKLISLQLHISPLMAVIYTIENYGTQIRSIESSNSVQLSFPHTFLYVAVAPDVTLVTMSGPLGDASFSFTVRMAQG